MRLKLLLAVLLCLAMVAVGGTAALADVGPYKAKTAIDGRGSMDPNDRIRTDAYLAEADIMIRCQDTGPSVGGSTIWDYTSDLLWVPDVYVRTGTTGFLSGVPRCLSIGIDGNAAKGSPHGPYKVKIDVDGRGSPNPDDRVRTDAYLGESQVFIKCQEYGLAAGGSTLWDYTGEGLWVPDAYITTGTDGWISGMPSCSSLGIATGGTNTAGGRQFLVRTTLNGYRAKSLSAAREEDRYADGSYITIKCQAYGEANYGGSSIWDLTTDDLWVADYYVRTGSTGIVMNRCDGDGPGSGGGNRFLVRTTLNGYHAKSLTAAREEDRYGGGTYVTIKCQAYGQFNYGGSAVWDLTSDDLWVADYYVRTGSSDIIMNRCDNDPKPAGGGNGNPATPLPPGAGSVGQGDMRYKIVQAAYSQLGVSEWGDNCNPYGAGGTVKCGWAWCSMFASWTWRQAGIDVFLPYSGTFYSWGRNRGTVRALSDARPGDVVLFGYGASASEHVGVVVDVYPDGRITTIEGNFHDEVRLVGPFSPYGSKPGGHNYPIYGVVSPIADSSTAWAPSDGFPEDANAMICTQTEWSSGLLPEFKTCLENNRNPDTPSWSPGPWVRVVAMIRSVGGVNRADITLRTPDLPNGRTTTYRYRCESALTLSTYRKCVTPWQQRGIGGTTAEVVYNFNGATVVRNLGDLPFRGWAQSYATYCGPSALQAVLASTGADPVPSQGELDGVLGTSVYGTLPNKMADYPVKIVGYQYNNNELVNINDNDAGLIDRTMARIRRFIDRGQPTLLLAKSANLPWVGNVNSLLRHWLPIHGYATQGGTTRFRVWDPQTGRFHFMTVNEVMTAGQAGSIIAPDLRHFVMPREDL
ncbi:CHAP domain-containing protein [Nonomuraea spiralis]